MNKKIFITGCAKSGTTLFLRMCFAFENATILYRDGFNGHELTLNEFLELKADTKFLIGKRLPPFILSNVENSEFESQLELIKKNDVAIINIVRDGRDVILSDGHYVKPQRWISSIKQREVYKDVIDYEIRYEDLITRPDSIQKELCNMFGLTQKASFSDYPDYVPDRVYDWNVSVLAREGKGNDINYGKRKLSNISVSKDPKAYESLCAEGERPQFEFFLKELDYMREAPNNG